MYAALRNHFQRWLFQLRGPQPGVIVLVQRRIFVLPTRHGLMFAAMLMLMLTGSINYNLSLGFILTFLLGSMGVTTILYTFRNLATLRIAGGRARPVFAGDTAHFIVHLENTGDMPRYAVNLTHDKHEWVSVDIPARTTVAAAAGVPARRRGLLRPGRLTLFTRYPLGLVYAWAYLELDLRCVVYPRPAFPGLPLPLPAISAGAGNERGKGQEDFSGLRQYHLGDSPRHIAWKLAARDQGLLTKQFSGQAEAELWLDWSLLPAAMGVEEKLSHLARWVIEAHETGLSFGLRLPGKTVEMENGDPQRERCLEALALFELDGAKE
jgi:uncharacterized protein (DUF58 family)